jgi:tetratricopeptide (TPR) repeat protein
MVAGEAVGRVKSELVLPEADSFARDTLARLREKLGADYVVLGSYLALGEGGSMLRLDVRLQDVKAGETVAIVSDSGSQADLPALVGQVAAKLRDHLGLEAVSPSDAASLRASRPANADAARYYAEGRAKLRIFDTVAARDLLQLAVERDPMHARSHAALSLALVSLGEEARAREEARRAFDLSANLAREDRLYVEGWYYEQLRQTEKAVDTYRALHGFFPENVDYGSRLAEALIVMQRPQDALEIIAQLRKLPPPTGDDPRLDMTEGNAAVVLGDYERQKRVAAQAAQKGAMQRSPGLVARARLYEARASAALEQYDPALSSFEESRRLYERLGNRRGVAAALDGAGAALARMGHLDDARARHEEALAIYRELGYRSGIAASLNQLGSLMREQGSLDEAARMHQEAIEIGKQINSRSGAIVSWNNLGQVQKAQGKLTEARKSFSEALSIARSQGSKREVAAALENLIAVARQQSDTGALKAYTDELAAARR